MVDKVMLKRNISHRNEKNLCHGIVIKTTKIKYLQQKKRSKKLSLRRGHIISFQIDCQHLRHKFEAHENYFCTES